MLKIVSRNKWLQLGRFARSTSGTTLIEYGVALLVVIIVGAASISALAGAVGVAITDTASAF